MSSFLCMWHTYYEFNLCHEVNPLEMESPVISKAKVSFSNFSDTSEASSMSFLLTIMDNFGPKLYRWIIEQGLQFGSLWGQCAPSLPVPE